MCESSLLESVKAKYDTTMMKEARGAVLKITTPTAAAGKGARRTERMRS